MDLEQDFLNTAAETVAALKWRNNPPRTWTSDDGRTIHGWQFDGTSYGPDVKGNPGRGWWRESWGSTSWILTVDGEFWEHSFSGQDEEGKETELLNGLRPMPQGYLVGSSGKPFSKIKGQIERLPYL